MHGPKLNYAIQQSADLSDLFYRTLSTEATVNVRERFATAYLSLSLEHREAILLLVSRRAFASATALQRALLEAFVTGAWMLDNATDQEVQAIATLNYPPPSFEKMVQRLRKTHAFGKFFEIIRGHYGIFGDYAHGHRRQLSRWLGRGVVEPNYSEDQMIETLRHSDLIGVMAAIHREKIANASTNDLFKTLEKVMSGQSYRDEPNT